MKPLPLFCLPYSGATAMVYSRWRKRVPVWLDIRPLELPGRGARFNEPFATDLIALAGQLAQRIDHELGVDQPCALFGHSLGALLAFEVAHALRERRGEPLALCVSGAPAPSQRSERARRFAEPKTDAELMAELRDLGGTSEAVLAHRELMALTLPILRADFLLAGRYQSPPRASLRCPLHVLSGRGDEMTAEQLLAWYGESEGAFSLDMFEGDHFFIHAEETALLRRIAHHLAADAGRVARRSPVSRQARPISAV